jgi:1,4-alpha-glucan branching enzyme
MPLGRFQLCLHSHMPYVLSHGKSPHGTDWIDESAVECYLPLLEVLDRLLAQGIRPRWTVNMTPILAEQLADESFKSGFEDYCETKIAYAREDAAKFEADHQLQFVGLSSFWERLFRKSLDQFRHRWGRSILDGFRHFQEQGSIEVITCGATHGYLPLLGTDESVRAQVSLGVETYRKHFGRKPNGIWLPECAYRPSYVWQAPAGNMAPFHRSGVDEILAENGLGYFFVDSHMIRGGQPLGTYAAKFPQLAELFARSSQFFIPPEDERSEYEPYALQTGVTCFARDSETTLKVWSGEHGYPGDPHYLEFHKQLYPGRHRYWRISEDKRDLGSKQPYDPWMAFDRVTSHAADMIQTLKATMGRYRGIAGHEGTITAMYDTELFGHWWWEGPEFLYQCALQMHNDPDIECLSGSDLLERNPPDKVIPLPEGSWGEGGYHYVWLNDGNTWTWERLYPAEQELLRLIQLQENKGNELATEIVTQAAREILLAEASDWQFLISTISAQDYAELRFTDHIDRFTMLAGMARAVIGGRELSEVEITYLKDCRLKDAPFPDLSLHHWSAAGS